MPRKNIDKVGGFDERFAGWGGEDDAFALAMNHLCGTAIRINSPIYHLWHPRSDQSITGKIGDLSNVTSLGRSP